MLSSLMFGTFDVTDAAKSGWNNARPHLSFAALGGPLAGRDPGRSAGGGSPAERKPYVYKAHRTIMAKLYWRIKRNGKWTWVAASNENTMWCLDHPLESEYLDEAEEASIHECNVIRE